MVPRITQRNESRVIGVQTRTSNEIESQPSKSRISGLWSKFLNVSDRIPNKTNVHASIGLYSDYESDHHGEYSLLVGTEVTSFDLVPEGMSARVIPPGKYLVFPASGEMPEAVVHTWEHIWRYFSNGAQFKRAFTADYEVYDRRNPNHAEIHIAIK